MINEINNMIWETHPKIFPFLFHLFLPNNDMAIKVMRSMIKTNKDNIAIIQLPKNKRPCHV